MNEKVRSALTILLYVTILVVFVGTLKRKERQDSENPPDPTTVDERVLNFKQYRFCFFTIWNFINLIAFMLVAIVDEGAFISHVLSPSKRKLLNRLRSNHFHAVVAPSTSIVMGIFWGLYHYDRDLIFPVEFDQFLPLWMNHVLHTAIVVPVLVEVFVANKSHNFIRFRSALRTFLLYFAVYGAVYHGVYLRHGVWLYLVYNHMSRMQIFWFSLLNVAIGVTGMWLALYFRNRGHSSGLDGRRSNTLVRFKDD